MGARARARPQSFFRPLLDVVRRYAEHYFSLNEPLAGSTRREILCDNLATGDGDFDGQLADLVGPPLPPELSRAWRAFLQLHARRPVGTQFHRIPFSELLAYTALMHTDLTPLDLACIEVADDVYQAAIMERIAPNAEGPAPSGE